MVGHTFLYNAAVRRVKDMIDAGELGDVHYVFSRRLNLGIVRTDVDALWNLAPHDISIMHHWVQRPVERVSAVGHSFLQPGIADVVFGHMTYRGNIAGHLHVSWLDPSKVRSVTVVGSRKMLVFDDMSSEARLAVYDKGIDGAGMDLPIRDEVMGDFDTYAQHQLTVRAGDVWIPRVDVPEPLGQEVDELYRCIVHGRSPLADGRNGLAVVSTLERLSGAMRLQSSEPDGVDQRLPALAGLTPRAAAFVHGSPM
jgi:predicted dehydrogenase